MDSMNKSLAYAALSSVLDQATADADELLVNGDLCSSLLTCLSSHPELGSKVAEVFATLAREESFRDTAKEFDVLTNIVPLLNSNVADVRLQAMRAVGNLCIDHDPNREAVLSNSGCLFLVDQLSRCLDSASEDSQLDRMKCVTCGCILNVTNSNEKLSKELLGLSVVDGLARMVSIPDQSRDVIGMALRAIAVLVDYAEVESLMTSSLSNALLSVLKKHNGQRDILEVVIEIIGVLADNDRWKLELAESGCIDQLLDIEVSSLMREMMDIIILVVAEDKCLDLLCTANKVLSKTMEWMSSSDLSLEARASASLVVANIARNGANCLLLVEKGVVPFLVALAKMEEPKELFGKLHHSALSALRNLSIPSENKPLFLQLGVVDVGLSLLQQSTQAHVQLKALGLLRLLVDKQAVTCSHIISQEGLVGRVCELCAAVGPVHIQSEGSRLLAALVKYCQNTELMRKVATEEGIKWICTLLESEHALMVNDGLLALSLLATLRNDHVFQIMMKATDLPKRISSIIESHTNSVEIVSNTVTLIEGLCASGDIKSLLSNTPDLKRALQQLHMCEHSNELKRLPHILHILNIQDV